MIILELKKSKMSAVAENDDISWSQTLFLWILKSLNFRISTSSLDLSSKLSTKSKKWVHVTDGFSRIFEFTKPWAESIQLLIKCFETFALCYVMFSACFEKFPIIQNALKFFQFAVQVFQKKTLPVHGEPKNHV